MVIGRSKTKQIKNEPLLEYYFEIFEKVLSQDQRRLLVIGYSFSDEHINSIICKAVEKNGLKVYILSPESPKKLREKLCEECKNAETINVWNGVSGYFQSVKEILLGDSRENQVIREQFYDVLFGRKE
jgi:CO dehydrogenase/acetyl-CoA synthase epsilon subunit